MALKAGLGGYGEWMQATWVYCMHGEPGDKDTLPMSREQEMGHAFSREVYLQNQCYF